MSANSSSPPLPLLLGSSVLLTAIGSYLLFASRKAVPADLATTQSESNTTTTEIVYPTDKYADSSLSEKEKFLSIYPLLRKELLDVLKNSNELNDEALAWCEAMMDYNVPGGKLNRGMTVVTVVKTMNPKASPKLLCQAAVCGWAIEFLQAFFLVADDVMDDSQTRRGQPCWYKKPAVKLIAINDSFLLESFVFGILKRHFADEPYYAALQELMRDVVLKTEVEIGRAHV